MKTRERTEPTLAGTNTASAEYHVADQLLVIDWNAALPRRPGNIRPKTTPVIRPAPPTIYTLWPEPMQPPRAQAPRGKHTSIGKGIVWGAAIVTFGPILAGIAILITVMALTGSFSRF